MPTELRCEKCGSLLAALGGEALCPVCLMQEAIQLGDERTPKPAPDLNHPTIPLVASERSGDHIDRYQLLQPIGAGGMGIVYLAEQAGLVGRRVALKVIKLGMDTKAVIARFETERQILALMDHPHIARVLDAGVTAAGRPYFVMELVRGIKITEYCIQNRLPTRTRLDLFVKVCKAIQHAHQKGIIHRDLKPSNILVEAQDGVPVPKIIDFGIAKAISERHSPDSTPLTAFAQFLGPPAYMSPEQTAANGLDIDTRSDIYSLGVLLYELLAGQTPFDADKLRSAGLEAMCRTIREKEPIKPSACLARELAAVSRIRSELKTRCPKLELDDVSTCRCAELKELIPLVRGDLDWIVMKTLEKERARRYDTANGLAMDIQRYLDNDLVLARPPSATYRFQKLVRRNKITVAAVSAVAIVLIAGLTSSTWLYVREKANLQLALEAEQKATTVAAVLKTMLQSLNPELSRGRNTPILHEILDKTVERIRADLTSQPIIQAELFGILGNAYYQLEDFANAEVNYLRALGLRKKVFGEPHSLVAASLCDLGNAITMQERQPEGEVRLRQALAMRQILFGNEHPEVAKSLTSLADNLTDQRKLPDAEALQVAALAMQRKLLRAGDPDIYDSLKNLGRIYRLGEQWSKAEGIYREMLTLVPGKESLGLSETLFRLSDALRDQGKPAQAETAYLEGLAMKRRLLGSELSMAPEPINNLTLLFQRQGKLKEMETLFQGHLKSLQARLQADDAAIIDTLANLTMLLVSQDKFIEAESWASQCLSLRERKMPDDWRTFNFQSLLGGIYASQKKYADAEPMLLYGYQGMKEREARLPSLAEPYFKESLQRLVQFYEAMGHSDEAAGWRQELAVWSATNTVGKAQQH